MPLTSFLATNGLVLARLVERYSIEPLAFMRAVGIDASLFRDPEARIPSQLADAALARAIALIPDPAFGLHAAECWHPSNLGSLGYAWLSSGTLRTGLKRIERFGRILGRVSYQCLDDPDGLRFVYDHQRGASPHAYALADCGMSVIVDMCRKNYGKALAPLLVRLKRPVPDDASPYRDFYCCPVRFDAPEDSFVLPREISEAPLATANREIAALFDAILTRQLAALTDSDLLSRYKGYLLQQLTSGVPSIQEQAEALGMSRRTLQRKLGSLGLTCKGVLDASRYELALRYLDDPRRSLADITFLLGFSEQSAFTRAFRRWNGQSPTAYRAAGASTQTTP
jgi:AraC-like DNA-binding protein